MDEPSSRTETAEYDPASAELAIEIPLTTPGRYEVIDEIAEGGVGRVFRAHDRLLGREVAIKVMRAATADLRARFVDEACLTARLQHPAIVPVYDVAAWPSGEPFYVMPLLRGESLRERIERCASLEERLSLLPLARAVIEAIAFAHSRGVVHRDIKPNNVVVGAFDSVHVVDWGLAKVLDPAATPEARGSGAVPSFRTRPGAVLGTPAYMPPEQAAGVPPTKTADVYSLGALLYHLVAGVRPYDGQPGAAAVVLKGPPRPLQDLEPRVPARLLALIERAMARDPEQRFGSAVELAAAFHAHPESLG